MTIEYMEAEKTTRGNGLIFRYEVSLNDVEITNAIILPYQEIYAISIYNSGSSTFYFTNSSEDDIENNLANWVAWDGISDINKALTSFYVDNTSGGSNIIVIVKTYGMEY